MKNSCHSLVSHQSARHTVEVCPADQAEFQKRIGIETLGQRLFRELPELYARLQGNLDDRSESSLRRADDLGRSKEPHAIDESHQTLLIAAEHDLVMRVGMQKEVRGVAHEFGVDRLPLRYLADDALKT